MCGEVGGRKGGEERRVGEDFGDLERGGGAHGDEFCDIND